MKLILPLMALLLCGCNRPVSRNMIERNYLVEHHTNKAPAYVIPDGLIIKKSACDIEDTVFQYLNKGEWSVSIITWTNTRSGAWMTWTPTINHEMSLVSVGETWIRLQDKQTNIVKRVHQSGWVADGSPWLVVEAPLDGTPNYGGITSMSAAYFMENYRRVP